MSEKSKRIPGRTFFQYEDEDTIYIYSSLEEIVLTTDNTVKADNLIYINTNKHNKIYADSVRLNGNIELNAKFSFTLFARGIVCLLPGDTIIRSNGKSGDALKNRPIKMGKAGRGADGANKGGFESYCGENQQHGKDGDYAREAVHDGENGEIGGTITIYAHKIGLPDAKSRFLIEAKGGAGQQGQDGQDGGDGGNGFYRLYNRDYPFGRGIYQSGYGGRGGNATYGGKGGNGGAGGSISFCFNDFPMGQTVNNCNGGTKGLKGNAGKAGVGGKHSNDRSLNLADEWDSHRWERRQNKHNGAQDDREVGAVRAADGGFEGTQKPDGENGHQGNLINLNPDNVVSATYLMMMLERAKAMHLVNSLGMTSSPDFNEQLIGKLKPVCELLDWIIQRSEWVQSDDKRKKAERKFFDEEAFRDIYKKAIRLKSYAANGCNPFGESLLEPVIPNLSYDSLSSFLDEEIDRLGEIKTEYQAVSTASDVYTNKENAFSRRTNTNEATKAIYTSKKEECYKELPEVATNIDSLKESLAIIKGNLIDKAEEFRNAVTAFSFPTWDELINAITMTAFAAPLAVVESIDLFHKGMTETSTDDGLKINKEFIIQKTAALKGDFEKSLKISYDSVTGAINPGNQGLIIADLQEYDHIVQKFMSYTSAKELHKLIQDFFDMVLQLNNAIMHYNTLLLQISQIDEHVNILKEEQAQDLGQMSKLNDPAVAYLTASLARRYSMALENCSQQLGILERAYRYSTLEDTSKVFSDLFSVDVQWGESYDKLYHMDLSDLRACKNELVKAYQDYLGHQTNPPSRYPEKEGDPGLFLLLETGNDRGRYEFIGDKGSADYRFEFNIVRSKDETLDANGNGLPSSYYMPELADFYDVRLLHDGSNGVRLHIELEDGSSLDNISAVLVHGAFDKIYNKNSKELMYRLKSNVPFPIIMHPTISSPKLPKLVRDQSQETYRQIGLYAHWTLVFSKRNGANPQFDPEKVKKIHLEFSVIYRGHA